MPINTTADGTAFAVTVSMPNNAQLCRGGWTLSSIFFFTPIKPGVLEIYAL